MPWRKITDAEIRRLSVPKKMFAYADAYLHGATALCDEMATAFSPTWADGAVVLMMSAHATELFLKGMLLQRLPEQQVWSRGHDLEGLSTDYRSAFPEPQFVWEVPFKTEHLPGTAAEETDVMTPLKDAPPSILYRYPVDKAGEDWKGLHEFEPNSFIPVLRKLKIDFRRLRRLRV